MQVSFSIKVGLSEQGGRHIYNRLGRTARSARI